jgi:restriction endonuclease S subunit
MPMLERPISKAGWTRVRFDQIATQINDRVDNPAEAGVERYVGLEHLDPDSLRIRRWGEPTDVESTKLRFRPGDIIFGKRRVYQRKVAVADFEGICSAHAMVLRAKPGAVLPEFLPFFMQSDLFMERALSISVGSLSPTINWKALAAEEFLLPRIQEQARLVEALSAFRTLQEKLDEAIQTSQVLRKAAFTGAITDTPVDREEIGKLARFSSGKLIRVSDLPKSRSESFPFPVVGGNGIAGYSDQPLEEVPGPCIAIGRVGEYCGAVHFIDEPCWVTDNALYVKSHTDSLQSRFFELCLQNLHLNRHATGGAQPLMTQTIINRFKIPVPALEKQHEIISADLAITANLDAVIQRLAAVRNLGRKLLIQCFEA